MTIGTRIYTWLNGELVGTDRFGNRYYHQKTAPKEGWRRRWVLFKGSTEATKVPPEWHAWLHYTVDQPIDSTALQAKPWVKDHIPNLSGTPGAFLPAAHDRRGGPRQRDYESWRP